jgi:hypothetical protein
MDACDAKCDDACGQTLDQCDQQIAAAATCGGG